MKEEVAVSHPLCLVVNNLLTAFVLVINRKIFFSWKITSDMLVTAELSVHCSINCEA